MNGFTFSGPEAQMSDDGVSGWVSTPGGGGNITYYGVDGLTNGVPKYFRVRTTSSQGPVSPWSDPVVATPNVPASGFRRAVGNAVSTTSGNTLVITTTAPILINELLVIRVAADNLSATTPTITATMGAGDAITSQAFRGQNATGAGGIVGAILARRDTGKHYPTGTTITITFSGAIAHKAAYAEAFYGFQNVLRNAVVLASGATTAATVTSGTPTSGDLVIGAAAIESRVAPTAYDTDTSAGSWSTGVVVPSATTGSPDTGFVEITGQSKVVNAATAQTYNLTNANTDWAAMVAIFTP
jgi:hypothetical protein